LRRRVNIWKTTEARRSRSAIGNMKCS
jgi:hypothetical protein